MPEAVGYSGTTQRALTHWEVRDIPNNVPPDQTSTICSGARKSRLTFALSLADTQKSGKIQTNVQNGPNAILGGEQQGYTPQAT